MEMTVHPLPHYNGSMHAAHAYLPADRRRALYHKRTLPDQALGTVLFVDISGFTPLTESLARHLGRSSGAEVLTRTLNEVYQALIDQANHQGGSVIGFAGDAITCWFDAADDSAQMAALRAASSALAMQRAMERFAHYAVAPEITADLAIKAALASGPVHRLLAGNPAIQVIEVLAGAPLERMAAAEHVADRGELVADNETIRLLDSRAAVGVWRRGEDGLPVAVLSRLVRPRTTPHFDAPPAPSYDLPDATVRPWLLPAVWANLAAGEERFLAELRPATALFVRFTGLDFEQDPAAGEHLDRYIRWVQQVLARHAGSLIQLTTGDKGSYLYAAFGAPIAHDDDTERAAAAALELRNSPAAFAFIDQVQLGISQGTMRVGAYGSSTRRTYGVLGDETNMAARLMMQAEAGQILVSQRTAELLRERFRLEPLGERAFKGKAGMQAIFALGGERSPTLLQLEALYQAAPVGRDEEMAVLAAAVERAAQGGGQVVRIEGEAGAGKSHLAAAAAHRAAAHGFTVLYGACQSTGQQPHAVLGEPLAYLLGLSPLRGEPVERQVEHLRARLEEIEPAWLVRLPLLGDLLGLPIADNPTTAAFDPRLRREALANLVIGLLHHAARRQPLLLLLEDIHWLDEADQTLVLALSRALADAALLLLLVHRPALRDDATFLAELVQIEPQTYLSLAELSPAAVAALVSHRLHGPIEPLVGELVYAQTQGNPFFAEELTDALRESGKLVEEEGLWQVGRPLVQALHERNTLDRADAPATGAPRAQWRLKPDAHLDAVAMGLPDTVHGLVLSRLDRLPDETRLTLKVASVIGRIFETAVLTGAHPRQVGNAAIEQQLGELERRDFARLESPAPRLAYIFKHSITQEAVYQTLLASQRQELHLAVARVLEMQVGDAVERLAHHYTQADLRDGAVRAQAIRYLDAAARRAQRNYANETALAYFERALALETRWEWLHGKAEVLHILGRRVQEEATLLVLDEETAPTADAAIDRALLWAEYHESIGEYGGAEGAIVEARRQAEAAADQRAVARCLNRRGIVEWRQGNYGEAAAAYQEALAIAQAEHLAEAEAEARYGLGLVYRQQGQLDEAAREFSRNLAINAELANRQNEARALNAIGHVHNMRRSYPEAIDAYRRALEIRREIGDRAGEGASVLSVAQTLGNLGDHSQAEPLLRQALAIQRSINNRWEETLIYNELGILYLTVGDYGQAINFLQAGLAGSRSIGSALAEAYILCNLGQVQREMGAFEEAAKSLSTSQAMAIQQGDVGLEAICWGDLALTSLRAGRYRDAQQQAQKALAKFEELEQVLATTSVLATLATAQLHLGDDAALDTTRRLLHILDECGGEGPDFPQRDYWMGAAVLDELGHREEASPARRAAYQLLMARAARISDATMRSSYLENITIHREIAAYHRLMAGK